MIISTPRTIRNLQSIRNKMTPLQTLRMKETPNSIYPPHLMIYYHYHHQIHPAQKTENQSVQTLLATKIENPRKRKD